MIKTAFAIRKERAARMEARRYGPYRWWVPSQSSPTVCYLVELHVDNGEVMSTYCRKFELVGQVWVEQGPGPDWQRQQNAMEDAVLYGYSPSNPGISQANYCPLCKHVIAAGIDLGIFSR